MKRVTKEKVQIVSIAAKYPHKNSPQPLTLDKLFAVENAS